MFTLISPAHLVLITDLVDKIPQADDSTIVDDLDRLINQIKNDIPEKKRVSTGRYSIVKALGLEIYPLLEESQIQILDFSARIFENPEHEPFVRSFAIQLAALFGLNSRDLKSVLPYFERAAADQSWIVRECSSGFIRKLTKAFPEEMRTWYLEMVHSEDPNQRRFVSESLRPVVENRWIHKDPEYALGIIKHLFFESSPYPRTSVGNNLSDWVRVNEELAWPIIEELASNGDKNSHWIAYRACRNLVKKKPLQVMELLDVEEYKYKSRVHRKTDYLDQ